MNFCLTSSGRIDLLRITVKSFLRNCMDLDLIDGYYVFDDNSDRAQLEKFLKDFPQFRVLNCDRGQAFSLNCIWEWTKDDDWYFHCEDDWEFIAPGHYIRDALQIAALDEKIKNVTLRFWEGVCVIHHAGVKYRIHTHKLLKRRDLHNPNEMWEFCVQTDNQWYGLSFNPGIISPKVIKELGAIDPQAYENPDKRGWDKELARKYLQAGFKRANLTSEYIKHIGLGRRTLYAGN